jgi:hypothetical protein
MLSHRSTKRQPHITKSDKRAEWGILQMSSSISECCLPLAWNLVTVSLGSAPTILPFSQGEALLPIPWPRDPETSEHHLVVFQPVFASYRTKRESLFSSARAFCQASDFPLLLPWSPSYPLSPELVCLVIRIGGLRHTTPRIQTATFFTESKGDRHVDFHGSAIRFALADPDSCWSFNIRARLAPACDSRMLFVILILSSGGSFSDHHEAHRSAETRPPAAPCPRARTGCAG